MPSFKRDDIIGFIDFDGGVYCSDHFDGEVTEDVTVLVEDDREDTLYKCDTCGREL